MSGENRLRVSAIMKTDFTTGKITQEIEGFVISDGNNEIRMSLYDVKQMIKMSGLTQERKKDESRREIQTTSYVGPVDSEGLPIPISMPKGFTKVKTYESRRKVDGLKVFYVIYSKSETGEYGWYDVRNNKIKGFNRMGRIEDPHSALGKFLVLLDPLGEFSAYRVTETYPKESWQRTVVRLRILEHAGHIVQVAVSDRGVHYVLTQKGKEQIRQFQSSLVSDIRAGNRNW